MPQITTVIFDMYGTLVQNPNDTNIQIFSNVINQQGLKTTAQDLWNSWLPAEEEFQHNRLDPNTPLHSYLSAWKDGFERSFATLKLNGDPHAATQQFFRDISSRDPYPETNEALADIQGRYTMGLLSNADDGFLLPNLELLEVGFDVILTSEQAQVYKPRPELFHMMLDQLGAFPSETVYVGDRQLEDVQGPLNAGIHPVWINRDKRSVDSSLPMPPHQISSLSQLPGLLHNGLPI